MDNNSSSNNNEINNLRCAGSPQCRLAEAGQDGVEVHQRHMLSRTLLFIIYLFIYLSIIMPSSRLAEAGEDGGALLVEVHQRQLGQQPLRRVSARGCVGACVCVRVCVRVGACVRASERGDGVRDGGREREREGGREGGRQR